MHSKFIITALYLIAIVPAGHAGTIANSTWVPSKCGAEPVAPALKLGTEEDYNASIAAVNEWQKKANTYNTCVVDEANADNALISKSANAIQSRFQSTVDKIKQETAAAKTKLGG